MGEVIQNFKEQREARLCHFEVRNILIDNFDLFIFHQVRISSRQFLLDALSQSWRYLNYIVLNQRQKLIVIIAKKIKDRLCSAASAGTRLHDSYLISFLFFLVMLMCIFQIVCYRHTVVGLEYLARCQPRVLWIVFS